MLRATTHARVMALQNGTYCQRWLQLNQADCLGDRLTGGNSRPANVSCPAWTQAEFGLLSFPDEQTFAVCLYYGLEALEGPF